MQRERRVGKEKKEMERVRNKCKGKKRREQNVKKMPRKEVEKERRKLQKIIKKHENKKCENEKV